MDAICKDTPGEMIFFFPGGNYFQMKSVNCICVRIFQFSPEIATQQVINTTHRTQMG